MHINTCSPKEASMVQKIVPHLWLEKGAAEAAEFYVSIFRNSRILRTSYYPEAAEAVSGQKKGSVMTVTFELEGQEFMVLNGGPAFRPTEGVSFMVMCDTQEEIDYYWNLLSFVPEAEQCGWLKDKFGVSWQIVPAVLEKMIADPDRRKVERMTEAFLQMKKFDIRELQKAFEG
jgi:predicted 3-demethylubiquinone-9 3-methyltransferase (glyoxalase superfamily)